MSLSRERGHREGCRLRVHRPSNPFSQGGFAQLLQRRARQASPDSARRVADALRTDILNGRYRLGQKLRELELASQFSVGNTRIEAHAKLHGDSVMSCANVGQGGM
jgi:hypothetical protein